MCDRRYYLGWLVGFVVALAAIPRAGEARITFVQEEGVEDGVFEYEFIGDLVVSPDEKYLYAVTAYSLAKIIVYTRAADTGRLDELAIVDALTSTAVVLALSPDGAQLYSLDYLTGEIVVYARDAATGLLTHLQTVQPVSQVPSQQWQGMVVSPDGAHVYATSFNGDNGVGVYARDASTGLLTPVEFESGMPGITWAVGIGISPDGAHVYVASFRLDGGIVVLARDAATGHLSWVQDIENGDGGQPLTRPFSVSVSPDGKNVYFAATQGVVSFQRNASTGVLTRFQTFIDGSDHAVLVTADGTRVYACGASNGLRGYSRYPGNGQLFPDETHLSGDEGFAPPLFCFGMAMTSNGSSLYTITTYDLDRPDQEYADTIGVFRRLNTECSATPLTGCLGPVAARTASVRIHSGSSSRLSWKARASGSAAAFADAVHGATDSALCVYDQWGLDGAGVVPGSAPCPVDRSCWQERTPTNLRYRAKANPDGVKTLKVASSAPGEVRLAVDIRGKDLPLPVGPLAGSVIVQLQLSNGTTSSCWSSTFSTPSRNDTSLYRAVSDP